MTDQQQKAPPPSYDASVAVWRRYAVDHGGLTEDEAKGLNRAQLRTRLGQGNEPPSGDSAPPADPLNPQPNNDLCLHVRHGTNGPVACALQAGHDGDHAPADEQPAPTPRRRRKGGAVELDTEQQARVEAVRTVLATFEQHEVTLDARDVLSIAAWVATGDALVVDVIPHQSVDPANPDDAGDGDDPTPAGALTFAGPTTSSIQQTGAHA